MHPSDRQRFRDLVEQARLLRELPNLTPELIASYPGVAWIKQWHPEAHAYTMVLLSDEYVRTLLGPKVIHYVGKTDFDFWPPEIAARFYENDEKARQGEPHWCDEEFLSPLTGRRSVFTGAKWSFMSGGETFVAGAGRSVNG